MTRFELEISGRLGLYWQQNAEKEVKDAVARADEGATVNENGAIAWKTNGVYLMDDLCEKLEYAGYPFSRKATQDAREAQVSAGLDNYRRYYRQPSWEELKEMRRTFGEGTTVVDVITGAKIQL